MEVMNIEFHGLKDLISPFMNRMAGTQRCLDT